MGNTVQIGDMQYEVIKIEKPWELLGMSEKQYTVWIEEDMENWC
jgi:hypothetical protein